VTHRNILSSNNLERGLVQTKGAADAAGWDFRGGAVIGVGVWIPFSKLILRIPDD
jgi:hypothetical protein